MYVVPFVGEQLRRPDKGQCQSAVSVFDGLFENVRQVHLKGFRDAEKCVQGGLAQFALNEGNHADVEAGTFRHDSHRESFALTRKAQRLDDVGGNRFTF